MLFQYAQIRYMYRQGSYWEPLIGDPFVPDKPPAPPLLTTQGNVLLQIGSMPHELALENIELFGREVLPGLRDVWDDEGWVNRWWPERLRQRATAMTAGIAAGGA